jgi:DNA-directed RNA polymerase specialized sigma24 family protein
VNDTVTARHVERLDEDALVALVRQGDALAFAELDRRYRRRLVAGARSLLRGTPHDPEDAAQDVLIRAYGFLLRHPERPIVLGAWLRVVLRNRCLDLRSERREHAAELEDRAAARSDPSASSPSASTCARWSASWLACPRGSAPRSSRGRSRAPRTSSSPRACTPPRPR